MSDLDNLNKSNKTKREIEVMPHMWSGQFTIRIWKDDEIVGNIRGDKDDIEYWRSILPDRRNSSDKSGREVWESNTELPTDS